ncbi:MAG: hypothetical protein N2490_05290 [Ignavibacteria bacterium]|nr:hypothetical protein [Ignavibacteria bacterium]
MKSSSFWKKLYLILIIILFIETFILLTIYLTTKKNENIQSEASTEEKEEQNHQWILKRRYYSLINKINSFKATTTNSSLTSVYVRIYEQDNSSRDFFYVRNLEKTYISDVKKFLFSKDSIYYFPLVNVKFPFLNIKDNAYSYLHPILAIKMLYIFDRVKFKPRLSDALRESHHQIKYKKRGWTDVEKSPHLIGLAFDISKYTWEEKKSIEKLTNDLSLSFLQHGGRRNMHIHIQDDKIWTNKHISKNVLNISEQFIEEYHIKESLFNKYKEQEVFNLCNYSDSSSIFFSNPALNKYLYSFKKQMKSYDIVKLEIFNILGDKIIEIYTLMGDKTNNELIIDFSFLGSGIYKLKVYEGVKLVREENLKIY